MNTINASASITQLNMKRSEWLDITRKNKFEDGIHRLLSEMYPDQAHFIYELLQNAEDAKASVIQFHLSKNFLKVIHDGKRLFNYSDVESITSIGESTKKDDMNQIGKFGVGFKAVFAYTSSPKIYSGPYNFKINDLVCPTELEPIKKQKDETVFYLPFNNIGKTSNICFKEISDVFKNMENIILLFLNHIEVIEWKIDGYGDGIIMRSQQNSIHSSLILISNNDPANEKEQKDSWYLRFQKKLPKHDKLKSSIAFKLAFRKSAQKQYNENIGLSEQMKIIPDNGKLCIFFPAEKESTGLKFHINGPFASTIDRASISHKNIDNISILTHASELLTDSMEELKGLNLINASFLSILPNDDDELSPFYNTTKEMVYKALHTKKIIPTKDKSYAVAGNLIRGSKRLSDFFSDEDISFLVQKENSKWSLNVMRNERPDKLLRSLGILNWRNKEFHDAVSELFYIYGYYGYGDDDQIKAQAQDWLLKKDISWFRQFYILLWTAIKREGEEYGAKNLKIILTEDHSLSLGCETFFPPQNDNIDLGLNIIKKDLFINLKKEKRERLIDFFNATGSKEISEKEEIDFILNTFYQLKGASPSIEQHENHVIRFISFYNRNKTYHRFDSSYLLLGPDKHFRPPGSYYIDKPFTETGLINIEESLNKKPLWKGYVKIEGFEKFAKMCGVVHKLPIKKTAIPSDHPEKKHLHEYYWQRHNHYKINNDYTIESIDDLLSEQSKKLSKLIWDTMCSLPSEKLFASFRPNKSFQTRFANSTLVHKLCNLSWIPTKNGNFLQPKQITKQDLSDNFEFNNQNNWLSKIRFGEEQIKATIEYKEKEEKAKDLGISLEDADLIKKYHDEFLKWKESQISIASQMNDFPTKRSKNPKRRKEKFGNKLIRSSPKKYEKRERSVRTTGQEVKIQSRQYLLDKYTNDDRSMFCQICQKPLSLSSFKKKNGEYYFECIEILDSNHLTIEEEAQHIALCPLCSAKYREYIKNDKQASLDLSKFLSDSGKMESDNYIIPLNFGAERASLKFVEIHYNDIFDVLEYNPGDE